MLDTSDLPFSKEVKYLVPDEFKEHSLFNELLKERNGRKDDIATIRREFNTLRHSDKRYDYIVQA